MSYLYNGDLNTGKTTSWYRDVRNTSKPPYFSDWKPRGISKWFIDLSKIPVILNNAGISIYIYVYIYVCIYICIYMYIYIWLPHLPLNGEWILIKKIPLLREEFVKSFNANCSGLQIHSCIPLRTGHTALYGFITAKAHQKVVSREADDVVRVDVEFKTCYSRFIDVAGRGEKWERSRTRQKVLNCSKF